MLILVSVGLMMPTLVRSASLMPSEADCDIGCDAAPALDVTEPLAPEGDADAAGPQYAPGQDFLGNINDDAVIVPDVLPDVPFDTLQGGETAQ